MVSGVRPVEVTGESLGSLQMLSELALAERKKVAKRLTGFRYQEGHQIVSYTDPSRDVFLIVSGKVRVTLYSRAGREVTFRDLGAGDSFGEVSAIDGGTRSATVVSLADTFVARMAAPVFWELLEQYPSVSRQVLEGLAFLVRRLTDRVVEFSTLGVNNRIHAELLRLARANPSEENHAEVSPVPTHMDIANRVSTHREAVTRELARLSRTGMIERRKGTLLVPDVERLERMVQEVTGE